MTRFLAPALVAALALAACRQAADPTLVRLNGRIEAALVDLRPKVTGRVREVLVREGDRVKAGDVLVRLDLGETGLTVARDKSAVASAQSRVRDLEAGTRKLGCGRGRGRGRRSQGRPRAGEEGAGPPAVHARAQGRDAARRRSRDDRSRAADGGGERGVEPAAALREGARRDQVQQARDEVARAETVLEQSQTVVNEGELRAPADTVVVHRFVEPGQLVTPGQPTLTLAFLDRALRPHLRARDRPLGRVRPGMEAEVVVDAYQGRTFKGKVAEISRDAEFTPEAGRDPHRARQPGLRRQGRPRSAAGTSRSFPASRPRSCRSEATPVITTSGPDPPLRRRHRRCAGITLSMPRGEMFALIGPDGAGKTTFFRLVAGVLAPTSGTVTARDRHLRARAAALRPLRGPVDRREPAAARATLQRAATPRPSARAARPARAGRPATASAPGWPARSRAA